MKLSLSLACVAASFAFTFVHAAGEATAADSATIFINTREDLWFKHKSPDLKEAYPFGRSDAANNAILDKAYDFSKISTDNLLRNKHYLAEGDWYGVEWNYIATDVKTGRKQTESSLCLGQIKDQKLISWIEYFDDTVGELQIQGKLPLPEASEEPYPWPLKAGTVRPYRP